MYSHFYYSVRPLFFAKLVYELSLPEISENLNKNKNEIPVFYSLRPKKRLRVLLLSLLVHMHPDIGNMTSAYKPSQG